MQTFILNEHQTFILNEHQTVMDQQTNYRTHSKQINKQYRGMEQNMLCQRVLKEI